jgi:hypothetical protein
MDAFLLAQITITGYDRTPLKVSRCSASLEGDSSARVWVDPLEFSFVEGFREHECNEILRIANAHLGEFLRAWCIAFGALQT